MASSPVVLVHGYMDDTEGKRWDRLEDRLVEDGYDRDDIYRASFSSEDIYVSFMEDRRGTTTDSPEQYAQELQELIEDDIGQDDVSILAHSMGGLAARSYIEDMDGDDHVESLVTLGTPHQGSLLAWFGQHTRGGRAMRPGSTYLQDLNEDIAEDVEYTVVYSSSDRVIQPSSNARMPFEDRDNVVHIEVDTGTWIGSILEPPGTHHHRLLDPDHYDAYSDRL